MEEILQLTSPVFGHTGPIPSQYTADGENTSPPLTIGGVSAWARSLVLIVDDPDAATDPYGPGRTYNHWVLFNIPPDTTEIAANSVPAGATQGRNSAGGNDYTGPAPPTGAHRYFFKLYELKDLLTLGENATKDDVEDALEPVLLRKNRTGRQLPAA